MTINLLVPFGASLNSFQIKTPHAAATMVAPCPRPYEIANPAFSPAIILNDIPMHHMIPFQRPIHEKAIP